MSNVIKQYRKKEQGMVLVTSMLILLVMTLIGITSMGTATMEEKMARNTRDMNFALQAAESVLETGERVLQQATLPIFNGATPGLYPANINGFEKYEDDNDDGTIDANFNWSVDAVLQTDTLNGVTGTALNGLATQPRYYIEEITNVTEQGSSLVIGIAPNTSVKTYYKVTARASGLTDISISILQTTYRR